MKIALCGYKGKMGKEVYSLLLENFNDVIAIEKEDDNLLQVIDDIDLLIDFTNKESALKHIYLCLEFHVPFIVGTTNFSYSELQAIKELCLMNNVKGVICYNFSIVINYILKSINAYNKHFDEISYIDIHHVSKLDKLSGTAYLFTRQNDKIKIKSLRTKKDTITYIVQMTGKYDKIIITYQALSRKIFALGLIDYLKNKDDDKIINLIGWNMDIKKISEVISIIKKNKHKAYLVGGSSRDFIFSRDFNDVDIATSAPLDFIYKTFNVVNEEGKSMGSLKISYKNVLIDITQFREETYLEKSTFPKVVGFSKDPYVDAKRRDFTINAIYLDITTNEIIDPYDGVKDLFSFKLRFIGDPLTRIKEDPSRILRGIRLAYKLNISIEEETNQAFLDNISELERLSNNKFNKEIEKMDNDFNQERTNAILSIYKITRR